MLIIPDRKNKKEYQDCTFFNNYNSHSFVDCFKSFPTHSAIHILDELYRVMTNAPRKSLNTNISPQSISFNELLFTKHYMVYVYGNEVKKEDSSKSIKLDLEKFVKDGEVETLMMEFVSGVFFKFYFFDNHTFLTGKCVYTNAYSSASNLSSRDNRFVDFFIDNKVFDDYDSITYIYGRIIDAMIVEYITLFTQYKIPTNVLNITDPPYIILPEFINPDGLIFIYNYFSIFNDLASRINIDDHVLGDIFYTEKYSGLHISPYIMHIIRKNLSNEDSINEIFKFYFDNVYSLPRYGS